jgi:homoserine O-succinyltransferase
MDGIGRRKSEEKNFGVFDCEQVTEHQMTRGLSPRFRVPHSRWNGVAQKDLTERGYSILSRIAGDGIDSFIKQEKSLFVFFQGHLEYEPDTLMREYRRDVGRYLKGETNNYPLLPCSYFHRDTEKALTVLRNKAAAFRTTQLLAGVVAALEETKIKDTWQRSAIRIYRNWLDCIRAQKSESQSKRHAIAAVAISR